MNKKYAILDTDFISKLHKTKNKSGVPFIEHLLKLPYSFCCHEQIWKEISCHGNETFDWLKQKITEERIICYSDREILTLIQDSFHIPVLQAINLFLSYLQKSCEIYSKYFYQSFYSTLESTTFSTIEEFCTRLDSCDIAVGHKNNLGEIKDTLLLLALSNCTGAQVFQFCSDDKRARRSIMGYGVNESVNISCISAFGFFFVTKVKNLLTKDESLEYLSSWLMLNPGNITIKTNIDRKQPDFSKRNVKEVFDCIWNNTMFMEGDGYLRDR